MQLAELKDLMAQFDQSSLTEFNLKDGSFELYLNKNTTSRAVQTAPVAQAPVQAPATEAVVAAAPAQAPVQATPAPAVVEGVTVDSPLVGVVY